MKIRILENKYPHLVGFDFSTVINADISTEGWYRVSGSSLRRGGANKAIFSNSVTYNFMAHSVEVVDDSITKGYELDPSIDPDESIYSQVRSSKVPWRAFWGSKAEFLATEVDFSSAIPKREFKNEWLTAQADLSEVLDTQEDLLAEIKKEEKAQIIIHEGNQSPLEKVFDGILSACKDPEKPTELESLITHLKSGEYDGTHVMMAWIALKDLNEIQKARLTPTLSINKGEFGYESYIVQKVYEQGYYNCEQERDYDPMNSHTVCELIEDLEQASKDKLELDELRKFRKDVFDAHPNIDQDILLSPKEAK